MQVNGVELCSFTKKLGQRSAADLDYRLWTFSSIPAVKSLQERPKKE